MKIVKFSFKVYYLPKTNICPKELPKCNKRKDKSENWMTDELLNHINRKNDMYVDWKYKSKSFDIYNTRKTNFKTDERIVHKNIQEAKSIILFIIYLKLI